MPSEFHTTVGQWCSCARDYAQKRCQRNLQVFSSFRPLVFVVMPILRPRRRQMTDPVDSLKLRTDVRKRQGQFRMQKLQLYKLRPYSLTTGRVKMYRILSYLLTDDVPQFAGKFFTTLCYFLELKTLMATTNYLNLMSSLSGTAGQLWRDSYNKWWRNSTVVTYMHNR